MVKELFFCESRNFWADSDGTDVPTQNGSLTRDIPSFGMLVCLLLLLRWCQLAYHQAADVAKADNQTWLTSGSVLMRAHQEIALGVYGLAGPTPPWFALQGPWEAFPTLDERHVVMTLTWPWWSLEGSILTGRVILATHLKKKLSYLMYFNSSVGNGLNSKCPRPTTLLYASWVLHTWERIDVCVLIIDKLWSQKTTFECMCVREVSRCQGLH